MRPFRDKTYFSHTLFSRVKHHRTYEEILREKLFKILTEKPPW